LLAAFEALYDGSWHGVKCIRVRDGGLFVNFVYSGSTVEHNVTGDHLRMRSRKATCFDCLHVLKPGVGVSVLSPDALQVSLTGDNISSVCRVYVAVLFYLPKIHNVFLQE
jgi:DNA repair and recombination RAD54-like protein